MENQEQAQHTATISVVEELNATIEIQRQRIEALEANLKVCKGSYESEKSKHLYLSDMYDELLEKIIK